MTLPAESKTLIWVAVAGAAGRMGKEVVKAVSREKDLELAAAVDVQDGGKDAGSCAGIEPLGVLIASSLNEAFESRKPDVLVDFTTHKTAVSNIEQALKRKVACVVGTTGLTPEDFSKIESWCRDFQTPVLIAPNFALGAVLLMKFAQEASRYYEWGEIIELHHEKKLDAPSGTALRTAELMHKSRPQGFGSRTEEKTAMESARGADAGGIRIHSVRLPGLLAHQEVLLGGTGETLTLRHDTLSRECFMPGVILAVRRIRRRQGLIVGLENILS